MKAANVARRDAILCAVRDGALVTTHEVCAAICETCRTSGNRTGRLNPVHCYSTVYQQCRALARRGLLVWTPAGENGYPYATWMLTMAARELFVTEDLEALWVASS